MTRDRFTGRVVLVTGSTGMAAAAARAIATEGGSLFVVSKTEPNARALAEAIPGSRWLAADLAQEEAAESAVKECVGAFGRLDAVFNVAGISGRRFGDGPVHELTAEGWDTVMAANVRSMFLVTRAAIRQMLTQGGGGAILNMSSVLAEHPAAPIFSTHAYAASKGAINAFSKAVAAHYAGDGIRVNVIAPAMTATPMSRRAQSDEATMSFVRGRQALAGGALAAEDVVGTALYLLSDDARMVTGQVIAVDGGWGVS
ncbi:MAG TPA: SDR family oxidoreductase [Candidatus Limnocylindrales bacterium]|nr:SDR family oxidoreductase [Candidatus Limnocylindrales bacterium]